MRPKNKKRFVLYICFFLLFLFILLVILFLYRYNVIPHRSYSNSDFGIEPYVSSHDEDGDGTDDQTDILRGAYAYVEKRPKYKSKYYEGGYPDDAYGVCTDVVAQGLSAAGYDLKELVNADIISKPEDYGIEKPDENIDFRRVRNLKIYFEHTATSLTTDIYDIEAWQGGDIVLFENHIGIVSDRRNADGVPFIIHHANPFQVRYHEDVLEIWGTVTGHYRIS